MNYSKPEIKILELDVLDVIATSGGNDYTPGEDQTPVVPRPRNASEATTTKYWDI